MCNSCLALARPVPLPAPYCTLHVVCGAVPLASLPLLNYCLYLRYLLGYSQTRPTRLLASTHASQLGRRFMHVVSACRCSVGKVCGFGMRGGSLQLEGTGMRMRFYDQIYELPRGEHVGMWVDKVGGAENCQVCRYDQLLRCA